jgi:hypothetical protein
MGCDRDGRPGALEGAWDGLGLSAPEVATPVGRDFIPEKPIEQLDEFPEPRNPFAGRLGLYAGCGRSGRRVTDAERNLHPSEREVFRGHRRSRGEDW